MSTAKNGDVVKVHYTGKLDDGTVFDSSREREPLSFELGQGQVIPGFEKAVLGTSVGESKSVRVPVDEGYGPHREQMVLVVPRQEIPDSIELEVGRRLQLQQQDGQALTVRITDLTEETVTLDGNHPLAGQDLNFEIELVAVG